ncbi:MAG: hypothetical protein F7C35_05110 [Desulfurococcales archaeon]|nr:hypothetical protein [Desulfurococcales archaeon]
MSSAVNIDIAVSTRDVLHLSQSGLRDLVTGELLSDLGLIAKNGNEWNIIRVGESVFLVPAELKVSDFNLVHEVLSGGPLGQLLFGDSVKEYYLKCYECSSAEKIAGLLAASPDKYYKGVYVGNLYGEKTVEAIPEFMASLAKFCKDNINNDHVNAILGLDLMIGSYDPKHLKYGSETLVGLPGQRLLGLTPLRAEGGVDGLARNLARYELIYTMHFMVYHKAAKSLARIASSIIEHSEGDIEGLASRFLSHLLGRLGLRLIRDEIAELLDPSAYDVSLRVQHDEGEQAAGMRGLEGYLIFIKFGGDDLHKAIYDVIIGKPHMKRLLTRRLSRTARLYHEKALDELSLPRGISDILRYGIAWEETYLMVDLPPHVIRLTNALSGLFSRGWPEDLIVEGVDSVFSKILVTGWFTMLKVDTGDLLEGARAVTMYLRDGGLLSSLTWAFSKLLLDENILPRPFKEYETVKPVRVEAHDYRISSTGVDASNTIFSRHYIRSLLLRDLHTLFNPPLDPPCSGRILRAFSRMGLVPWTEHLLIVEDNVRIESPGGGMWELPIQSPTVLRTLPAPTIKALKRALSRTL